MRSKFIGRKNELEEIKNFVASTNTGVLCIEAVGGIGKTRLLDQMQEEYGSTTHLYVSEIIDFDNPRFLLPDNIGREIAQQLGKDFFVSYLDALRHKRFLEEHKASPEYLARHTRVIEEEFLKCYQMAADQRQLILRFDTTDTLRGVTPPLEYIAWLAKNVSGTSLIIAGRDSSQILKMIGQSKSRCTVLKLMPLSTEECRVYLREKLTQKGLPMGIELMEKLVVLSKGRIILLDMAVEWLFRENVPKWLQDLDLSLLLEANSSVEDVWEEFEKRLFDHVRALRTDLDRLVLLLSKVHPLDKEGIKQLLRDLSDEEISELVEMAKGITFIKVVPNGYLKLHDEVEALINKYVWTQIDPARGRDTSEAAIIYLEDKSKQIQAKALTHKEIEIEYTFYIFCIQLLHHILALDIERGYKFFQKHWNLATENFRSPAFQKMLLDEILSYKSRLHVEQQWEVMLLQADRLLSEEEYRIAIDEYLDPLLELLLSKDHPSRLHALFARGNAYTHLGDIDRAVSDIKRTIELSIDLKNVEWEMRSILSLAWLERLKGDLDKAVNDYLDVLRRTLDTGDRAKQASVQCELAYLKALYGESESAIHLIEHAIHIWQHLNDEKNSISEDLGIAYYMAGVIYREIGQVGKAMDYFSLASDIFLKLDLEEWRSNTRAQRGIIYFIYGRYRDAETELTLAIARSAGVNLYQTRYYLAHVRWALGDRESAEEMFQQSLSEAQKFGDAYFELQVLCSLSRLAFEYEMKSLSNWQNLEQRFDSYRQTYPMAHFPGMTGIFLTHLGHLAVKQNKFQEAIEFYKHGLPLIAAQHTSSHFGDFNLYGQFRFIHSKVTRLLTLQRVKTLGEELERIWSQQKLDISHPEVLTFLLKWKLD